MQGNGIDIEIKIRVVDMACGGFESGTNSYLHDSFPLAESINTGLVEPLAYVANFF